MEPIRIAAAIDQLYSDTLLVETPDVVSDTVERNPLFNAAITINIKMPAIAGLGLRVVHFFAIIPCRSQVGQLRTMDYKQVDFISAAAIQALCVA